LLLTDGPSAIAERGWRLPAREIEHSVAAAATTLLQDKSALVTAIQEHGIAADRIVSILEQATEWASKLASDACEPALAALVKRVDLTREGFKLTLRLPTSPKDSSEAIRLEQLVPLTMKKRGVELRLVLQNEPRSQAKVDVVLMKTIARAHRWFDQLVSGEVKSLTAIATREGLNYRFVGKIIKLAFLAPEIAEAIAEGRQPPELSTELLTKRISLPLDWNDQKRLLSIG
jgi:site-specific DNA recombinase